MTYRRFGLSVSVIATAVAAVVIQSTAGIADINPQPVDNSHNVLNAPLPDGSAQFGTGATVKPGTAFCVSSPSGAANVNTDCAQSSVGPHNETSIAINPTDANNIIGGANDYQLTLNSAGKLGETIQSQAHVSRDGGLSWANYPVLADNSYQATGDPSLAFDADGTAYYATLGFRFVGPFDATNPDVLVSHSTDKGKTWDVVRVASGSGVETSVGDLLDKEYVAAWGHGNAIVTYGDFMLGQKGNTIGADTFAQVTHDGGNTWSARQLLSGGLNHQAFVATPVVVKDGSSVRVYVSFLDTTHLDQTNPTTLGRDDYEVDRVDPNTGAVLQGPVKVATTIDGNNDSPFAFGRETYQDSVFRSWAAGNIAADPTNPSHLAVVWSDWTHTTPPSALPITDFSPYDWKTDADVRFSESTDGGLTWSAPTDITRSGDQFQPWSVFDTNGNLRMGFFDRSYDSSNHMYGYTVATKTGATITFQQVTTTLSDPTTNDRWFARSIDGTAFTHATAFLGDYSNIAATADGHVIAYWTDMRENATLGGVTRKGEDAFFGRAA
jgi:hypothetical protein